MLRTRQRARRWRGTSGLSALRAPSFLSDEMVKGARSERQTASRAEASASLAETSLWIAALAEDASNLDEIAHLGRVLSDEIDRYLADSSQPVPVSARRALAALAALSPPGAAGAPSSILLSARRGSLLTGSAGPGGLL